MAEHKKATIADVARVAGVARSTVSKVMNGTQKLPETTEQRIWDAVRMLGYEASPHARSLSTGRSRALGLVILDIANPHFAAIVKGAGRVARESGYALLLADAEEDSSQEQTLIQSLRARTDGLILAGSRLPDRVISQLHSAAHPVVTVGRLLPDVPAVVVQEFEAAAQLTRHVIERGAQHPAYLAGPPFWVNEQRQSGYLQAAAQAGFTPTVFPLSQPTIQGGWQAAQHLLTLPRMPDALICYSDIVAVGVIQALHEKKISLPQQIQVVAFGPDNPFLPHLTHAELPSQQLGEEGAKLLIRQLGYAQAGSLHLELPTDLRYGLTSRGQADEQPGSLRPPPSSDTAAP